MNFTAGYVSDAFSDLINKKFPDKFFFRNVNSSTEKLKLKGLLENVSNFTVSFNEDEQIDYLDIHPVLAVQNNILTRGLPTRAPILTEDILAKLKITERNLKKEFEFNYKLGDTNINFQDAFEILHLISPSLNIKNEKYLGKLDSKLEWDFLQKQQPLFRQILQSQREFDTLTSSFRGESKRLDFSFTKPYLIKSKNSESIYKTIVFEVDGPHHLLDENVIYDDLRDEKIKEANGSTIRFSQQSIQNSNVHINQFIDEEILNILIKNYNRNITEYLNLYTLILLPFCVARIQKTLIEIFIRNQELLDKKRLKIAILERDVPGAALACEEFKNSLTHLNALLNTGDQLRLPELEIEIFQNSEWIIDEALNCGYTVSGINDFETENFDLVIDNSILIREGIYLFEKEDTANHFTIRSSHFVDNSIESSNIKYCSKSLKYLPLVIRNDDTSYSNIDERYPHIQYFLNNIFRKIDFRDGQLPIISRALQKLPVIGLLPTGGGKSLTFQIPVLMQPSLSIVIDPIKSLMEDQVRVLKENWIDCITYANSSQNAKEKNRGIADFKLGLKQIIFISPERFVIKEFREIVKHIDSTGKGQSIGYCVIDEVHCLSEWGHDFRYDYLMLGKNAQEYCFTRDRDENNKKIPVTLMGLTATATFDVLADIDRELQIESEDTAQATIMIENSIRPELFFKIVDVSLKKQGRSEFLIEEMQNFKKSYSYFNNEEMLFKSQRHHFDNFDPLDFCKKDSSDSYIVNDKGELVFDYNPDMFNKEELINFNSIVFCAVKGERKDDDGEFLNANGVRYIHSELKKESIQAVYYYGTDSKLETATVQNNFSEFLSGAASTMVCTKAFGMGIDKDDVRGTFHINYSGSLESLIQECGRAGRDKKTAVATIFADPNEYLEFDYKKLPKYYHGLNSFNMWVIKSCLHSMQIKDKEEFVNFVNQSEFEAVTGGGNVHKLSDFMIRNLREKITENIDDLLYFKSADRDIHDYFHDLAFKGIQYESAHVSNFFDKKEADLDGVEQETIREEFNKAEVGKEFKGLLKFSKKSDLDVNEIISRLNPTLTPQQKTQIARIFLNVRTLEDLWYELSINNILKYDNLEEESITEIEAFFLEERDEIESGRMIYRLNSIGLLTSYTKDYVTKIYHCVFYKASSIDYYINHFEAFLKRYQSEITVDLKIKELRLKLSMNESNMVDDILIISHELIKFSMEEIASKRKRATNEIQRVITNALGKKNFFDQNLYIKEETFYYFNAKYSKPNYVENGKDCSLHDDYKSEYLNQKMDPFDIIKKYTSNEIIKNGTEQNNYKHLIGSCKKINYSLTESDLKKDWVLKLLNAFAMYSANNSSYRNEANEVIEKGFIALFDDEPYHNNDYNLIQNIFKSYFEKLIENINELNPSIFDIDLIKNKLLQTLQLRQVQTLITELNLID